MRFLICTDVAARGIDIRELPYVINMTLPDKSEDYIHRVGLPGGLGRRLQGRTTLRARPGSGGPKVPKAHGGPFAT